MQAPTTNRFLLQNQDPRAKAVITNNFTLDFEKLTKKVLNCAAALSDKGISQGNCVGIFGKNST